MIYFGIDRQGGVFTQTAKNGLYHSVSVAYSTHHKTISIHFKLISLHLKLHLNPFRFENPSQNSATIYQNFQDYENVPLGFHPIIFIKSPLFS